MEAGQVHVGVRAAVHALDAALAEHRRALVLAASRRERERMAGGREVKAAARLSEEALEQPVQRPMRLLRLAETWIEVDRVRHPLTAGVRATVADGELRASGEDWSARLVLAPGDGPLATARDAAAAVGTAADTAPAKARDRLAHVTATAHEHAAACHAAATALAAADRDAAERHAERARVDACVAELVARLGPRRTAEPPEVAAARDRLEQARAHLAAPPAQPYAWLDEWPPDVAGAMLRDLPDGDLEAARPAMRRLAAALVGREPLLALTAGGAPPGGAPAQPVVAGLTSERVLVAGEVGARAGSPTEVDLAGDVLRVAGREVVVGLAERRPGRFAAVLELLRRA
jgi:hypothetical protein